MSRTSIPTVSFMSQLSRRSFLTTSSLSLIGASVALSRSAIALPMRSRAPVSSFFPDIVDPETLRTVALAGVEAARKAGAEYADVRVGEWQTFYVGWSDLSPTPDGQMQFNAGYGVRVRVGGAWSFAFGLNVTPDAITRSARGAVDTAREVSRFTRPPVPLAPAPVVRGEWETPIEIDPFAVSPDDHGKIFGALRASAERVPQVSLDLMSRFFWSAETRVFASSEGSLITQRLRRANPSVAVYAKAPGKPGVSLPVDDFIPGSAGFDCVTGVAVQEHVKATAEEASRLTGYPMRAAEVGRFTGVLDGATTATLLVRTLAPALELERALGYHADSLGTSWLTPPARILGQQIFSPLMTLSADRALPHFGAARWDDEGVATQPLSLIERGKVVDYFTTRETASLLSRWYESQGKPVVSRGSAVSWSVQTSPSGCPSQLTMASGARGTTLERMIQGILQFGTKRLWASVSQLGDATTQQYALRQQNRGETGAQSTIPLIAPAVRVSEIELAPMPQLS
jgi:TldD protein